MSCVRDPGRTFRRFACLLCALAACRAGAVESITERGVTVEFEPRDRGTALGIPETVRLSGEELARELGLGLPREIRVRLMRDGAAFVGPPEAPFGKPVELYAGMAYPRTGTIHVDARRFDRVGGSHAFLRTVRHECVHLAIGHTLGEGRLPRWFEEGLACHFGSPLSSGNTERLGRSGVYRLRSLTRFPPGGRATREGLSAAYAQVGSTMHFLVRKRGAGAVRGLLARVAEGEGFDEALVKATGFTVDSLDAAWRKSFRSHWGWRLVVFLFSPIRVLLWAALMTVAGYFVVRRRRRRQAEALDDYL